MKKLLILFFPLIGCAHKQSDQFIVEVDGAIVAKNPKIYLEYSGFSGSEIVTYTDSASVTNGKFTFTGKIGEPSKATIYGYFFGTGLKSSLVFFLAPGKTKIIVPISFEFATVKGTDEAEEFARLMENAKKFKPQKLKLVDSLIAYDSENDKNGIARVELKYKLLQKEIEDNVYLPFFLDHLNSPVGVYALDQITANNLNDPQKIEKLFSQITPKAKKLQSAIQLEKKMEGLKRSAVGEQALDFTMPDDKGDSISLSSFKGKYVLVDFWASWCMPCRAEAPNLIAAFNKYKNKNFTILGVALEKEGDREKWLRAIAQDNLSWTQVSDFKYWDNAAVKQYSVTSIPFNFLLDPQGKIIAKNIQGDELNDTLSRLFR